MKMNGDSHLLVSKLLLSCRMSISKQFFSFSLLMVSNLALIAQTQSDTIINLDPAVVTGTRIEIARRLVPLSLTQITKEDITNSGEANVLPMLNDVSPGIFVTERGILGFGVATGAAGKISVRGLGGTPNTQVLMLIDGHPQYAGLFSHPLPDAYVTSSLEKVEVIRGPASVLYGANAMGGVINLITRRPEQEGWHGHAQVSYGSYETQRYSASLQYAKDKFGVFASINHDRTEGVRDSSDFRITNGYLKVTYDFDDHWSAMTDFSLANFDYSDPGPVFAPASQYMDIARGKVALSLRNSYDKSSGRFHAYYNFGDHMISDGFNSIDHNSGITAHQSFSLFENGTLTAGFDYKNYGGNANRGFRANDDLSINEIGFHTYYQQVIGNSFSLNGGLRWENNELFGSFLSPFAGATVATGKSSTLKGAVSRGFRSPAIFELYLFLPNPELQPESIWNYEISHHWQVGQQFSFEATGFLIQGSNFIQLVFGPGGPMRMNTGDINHRGVEFAANYHPHQRVKISGNYSYLDTEKPILAAPEHQYNVVTQYKGDRFMARLSLRHIRGLILNIDQNQQENYTMVNLNTSWQILPSFHLQAALRNLLDQAYEINAGYPMPGINWRLGLRWDF